MQSLFLNLIALIWLIGTLIRVYRQARFYQIDEYKSNRYIRWLFSERTRWLPSRATGVFFVGVVLAFFTDSIPGEVAIVPYIVSILAALIASVPPDEGEIKKGFVQTDRATRMLGTAFVVTSLVMLLASIAMLQNTPTSDRFAAVGMTSIGFGVFLLAPLWLMLGNHLMYPVEAALRRRFIRQARGVLAAVQPKVIGITGSYGKTTTKNFLRDILSGRYKTYATPKSYNTMMGVCIALNNDIADDYSIEYFISEMGAYIEGEIARICGLTPPDISIVVEVGPQHLERFGSLENIAKAKYEIIAQLPPDGLGVFNWDNDYVREMYERGYPEHRIAVSRTLDPNDLPANPPRFIATDAHETLDGLVFTVHDIETGAQERIKTPVHGEHNVMNLLLTTAVCVHEGMTLRDVAMRARMLKPAESRLVRQVADGGITIINDAYSANPVGVVSALKVLGMHQKGRRVLVTPGMIELGDLHERENRKLGEIATQYATDIILVGAKQTEPIRAGVEATDFAHDRLQVVETLSDAIEWYKAHLAAGDTVLFLNDLPDTY